MCYLALVDNCLDNAVNRGLKKLCDLSATYREGFGQLHSIELQERWNFIPSNLQLSEANIARRFVLSRSSKSNMLGDFNSSEFYLGSFVEAVCHVFDVLDDIF